jgi:hypothetical protein
MFADKKSRTAGLRSKAVERPARTGLRIGEPDDAYEREADRVANDVMEVGRPKLNWSLSRMNIAPPLQRKCACGGSGGASRECEECKKKKEGENDSTKMVLRKAAGPLDSGVALPIVHEVLNSPGQPLDKSTREFFEPRFGCDFSRVRVHADVRAAESARAVNALAYAVGQDIAFGRGQYVPATTEGHRLLAHELAHTLQLSTGYSPVEISHPGEDGEQGADDVANTLFRRDWEIAEPSTPATRQGQQLRCQTIPVEGSPSGVGLAGPYTLAPPPAPLPEPCLKSPDCSKEIPGSSTDYAHKVYAAAPPTTTPSAPGAPSPTPTAAVNVKAFGDKIDPTLLSGIDKVLVNPALTGVAGAISTNCSGGAPGATGPACIEVPDQLEKQAEKFNKTKDPIIGGWPRADWETNTHASLTHEVTHTKFAKAPSVKGGYTANTQKVPNYSPGIFTYELGEMNSQISEFPIKYAAVIKSSNAPAQKEAALRQWIDDHINHQQEGLRGMLKKLKCVSPCDVVNDGVRKVFASQSTSWTQAQRDLFTSEVSDPKNGLDWPK